MIGNYSLKWTANLANDADKKKEFESLLANNPRILERLSDILDQNMKSIDKIEHSLSSYEAPGWSNKQSFLNGKRAAYEEIKQLL